MADASTKFSDAGPGPGSGPGPATTGHPGPFPLLISEWRSFQQSGLPDAGLACLLKLLDREAKAASNAWIALATPDQIRSQWAKITELRDQGVDLPLFGVPFATKDNIDAAGFRTTAACPAFAGPVSTTDATVVARLKAAGAILLGKTNLDQFATGLVGTRSPYGAVANPFDATRVSGGSSSGSAVLVARGVVPFALGTDTAGSGRVPAGLNNLVGLKPSRGALSTRGVVPACRSLDCVSVFTLTIDDAETVLGVAEAYDDRDFYSRKRPSTLSTQILQMNTIKPKFAICADPNWFGNASVATAYEAALHKARTLGWELEVVDFTPLFRLANLLYEGPWVAERYAAIQDFIESDTSAVPGAMDPVVRSIILKARNFSAADAFDGEYLRQDLSRQIEIAFKGFSGLLVPSAPTFPTLQEVARDPIGENAVLGTYTNFVNFMDWSALAVPAGFRDDGLPFGMTLVSSAWEEHKLLELCRQWLAGSSRRLGATDRLFPEQTVLNKPLNKVANGESSESHTRGTGIVPVVVVGAHLTGFPLNKDLISRAATLASKTTTAAKYLLFALKPANGISKPGLKRVEEGGFAIEVEVWNMPHAGVPSFLKTIPSPLGIGSVELLDGTWQLGFICEPYGLQDAVDISSFGGWRAYMASKQRPSKPIANGILPRPIKSVLIANRGEIAVRIARTLRSMAIRSVAIYSAADRDSQHVKSADEAKALAGSTVSKTYLDGKQILELSSAAGVDAIIPGYGFLAENAEFAASVEAAGLVWIGPTSSQMSELGLKHRARDIAVAAGVPVVPGSGHLLTTVDDAVSEAEKIGYPVMLKSTAGGGGIGLRVCLDARAVSEAFGSVKGLAEANFGDSRVFVERFIRRARHIEIQILGDGTGRVISVGDRDCSLQRRNQKVIEEAPALFVSEAIRTRMSEAAVKLAASVQYRNVGTVEFIYDVDNDEFFFLEVNTRLQVEHPVTESVTGLDLVECMVQIAAGDCESLFADKRKPVPMGSSIEVRIYAESPLQAFRPSTGRISGLSFPGNVRVDTWVQAGTEISPFYDPLIAKIIATGDDRRATLKKLSDALKQTRITGVETNLEYLRNLVAMDSFQAGDFTTSTLNSFKFSTKAIEVIDPGTQTAVQDFPGRTGLWHIGIPRSGPIDDFSFRLANRLVGNQASAAGLECTVQGPTILFHADSLVAVTGADAAISVDNIPAQMHTSIRVLSGQLLSVGVAKNGYRTYVAIQGGIDVPKVFGSRSTFTLGNLGGHNGRSLRVGDLLHLSSDIDSGVLTTPTLKPATPVPIPPQPHCVWHIGVVPGPQAAPDFLTPAGFETLIQSEWTVHYNSNRFGIRLSGPKPEWARTTGGEAGLHPSNIHDTPYSVGGVSFTGDEAVILACDGPSLGGFVTFCTVATAEMWKLGQLRPGDHLRFHVISTIEARNMNDSLISAISNFSAADLNIETMDLPSTDDRDNILRDTVFGDIPTTSGLIKCRIAGDRAMLLEFGDIDGFNMRQSFYIYACIEGHKTNPIPGVEELSPGVHTLHVQFNHPIPSSDMFKTISGYVELVSHKIPSSVRSRTIRLPLAFDDNVSRAAVDRYAATIRHEAPWLPSNVDFLAILNTLKDASGVSDILYNATFLVLGLGDVFLGSPCAVPLDPRHRLFGTKYNPSRSFTPRGSVGIGGQYMCIYAMESPGGYQLVGRTVPIWDDRSTEAKPWLFKLLDQITFYPLAESDLDAAMKEGRQRELIKVTEGSLDVELYERWLQEHSSEINDSLRDRAKSIENVPFYQELLLPYSRSQHSGSLNKEVQSDENNAEVEGERIKAPMPGRCWKLEIKEGDDIAAGDPLIWIESNKMELSIPSPVTGKCVKLLVKEGDLISPEDDIAIITVKG